MWAGYIILFQTLVAMGGEGAKQDTHLIKTQWHDKTEASRDRETAESSQEFGSLPDVPGAGGVAWGLRILAKGYL